MTNDDLFIGLMDELISTMSFRKHHWLFGVVHWLAFPITAAMVCGWALAWIFIRLMKVDRK